MASVRRRALAVGRRLEADLDAIDVNDATPGPTSNPAPIALGLDGGFVREPGLDAPGDSRVQLSSMLTA